MSDPTKKRVVEETRSAAAVEQPVVSTPAAERRARARAAQQLRSDYSIGDIANKRADRHYRWMPASELDQSRVQFYRDRWYRDGYDRLEEGDEEYVVGVPGAEIWWTDPETHRIHVQDRRDFARCEGNWDGKDGRETGARHWRMLQRNRQISMPID